MEKNSQPQAINTERLLHLWLGVIKFRFTTAISGTERSFASFDAGFGVRTPVELVCHLSQLLENCYSTLSGSPHVRLESKGWYEEAARFFDKVEQLDQAICKCKPAQSGFETFVQGSLTDVTSHIGQLMMLRRLSGYPVSYISDSQSSFN